MAVTTSYLIGLAGDQFQLNGFENGEQFGVSLEALPDGGFAALYGNEFTSTNTLALSFFDAAYAMQTMAASSTNYVFPYSSTALEVQMLGTPVFDLDSEGNLLLRWVRDSSGPGYGNDQMTASVDPETGAITSPEQMIGNTINIGDIALAVSETTGYQGTLTLDYTFESLYFSVRDSSGDHVVLYGLGEFDTDYLSVQNVALPSGEILLAFVEDGLTSNPIKMQVRQDTGAAAGVFFTIDPVGVSDTDTDLALAALPGSTGGFALAYVIDVDGGTGIGLQVINDPNLDADGSGLLRVDGMASSTDTDVALTVLENGLLLVSWTATLASGQTDIMARLYDEDGTPIGDPFLVSSGVTNAEGSAVEALANGDFAVGWIDALADSDGSSVQGQILAVTRTVEGDEDDNTLTGDLLADSLVGLGGNDTLVGAAGNDALFGDDDDDSLDGGTGDDTLSGGDGNDTIFGGAGDDTIDGDGGIDTADFSGSANGVSVTLSEGSTDGGATGEGTDVIRDIEIVIGSDSDDTITGNSEANTLDGGDGNDTIFGGAGNDTIDGDSGIDTADFSGSANGVSVTLSEGATDGGATGEGTDVIRDIEIVIGSDSDDTITGNSEANTLDGGTGDDTIDGGTGNDSIIGDIGNDTIRGERGDDSISGGDGDDDIKGGIGNDTIYGGDGGDDIAGGRDNDILYGGEGVTRSSAKADRTNYMAARNGTS